ncbi:MAG: sigma-70 family RNA polymerase sigma factor [Pseudomonadales bacterium]
MAEDRIALLLRAEIPGVRARLIGALRDFDRAEDALQDALERAWERWPQDGVPDRPAAWLYRVAERRAFDALRHDDVVQRHTTLLGSDAGIAPTPEDLLARADFDDDLLRLIFTCCHPLLRPDARAALTLRTVLDLSQDEVARAFLVEPRTLEQRLVRAKRRLREAGMEWLVPSGAELDARLDDVLRVAYLIFTEGYSATAGERLTRPDLCALAIVLMRRLNRMLRGRAEALGLLALMLLQDSRSANRTDPAGHPVLLDDQDRSRWDGAKIREGSVLLEKALHLRQAPGPYQIQAAIAALHANATSAGATDWDQITALYDALLKVDDTPVIRLNRAVAIAMARGAAAGMAELDRLKSITTLQGYHPYHAARGALLWRLQRRGDAVRCYRTALGLVRNAAEAAFLRRRIAQLEAGEVFTAAAAPGGPETPQSY